jgi:signal transduction histidine kinase
MQRLLLSDAPAQYRPNWRTVRIADIIAFLQRVFSSHPAASAKRLLVRASLSEEECHTDPSLLERILSNMLLNAFEATEAGHEVRLGVESSASEVHFTVWNSEYLAEEVASRIFQRYFSTKRGLGRGQGTYAIRLLGEKLLGGQVGFSSSLQTGTTFYLKLPTSGTPPSR